MGKLKKYKWWFLTLLMIPLLSYGADEIIRSDKLKLGRAGGSGDKSIELDIGQGANNPKFISTPSDQSVSLIAPGGPLSVSSTVSGVSISSGNVMSFNSVGTMTLTTIGAIRFEASNAGKLTSTSDNLLMGDGTAGGNKKIEFDIGNSPNNPFFRYNIGAGKIQFSNDGTIVEDVGNGGGGAGVGNATDPIELLLQHGQISNSAFITGLSLSNGVSNTQENFTTNPETDISFRGVSEYETNLIYFVDSIGGGSQGISATDGLDRSGEFLSGDKVQIFREQTIQGSVLRINIGVTKTLTSNTSVSDGVASVFLDASTDIQVGDMLVKESQLIKQMSFVSVSDPVSFTSMNLDSRNVVNFSESSFLSGIEHQWILGINTSGNEPDQVGANNMPILGTLTPVTGNHYDPGIDGFAAGSGNRYNNNASGVTLGTGGGIPTFTVNAWVRIVTNPTNFQNALCGTRSTGGGQPGLIMYIQNGGEVEMEINSGFMPRTSGGGMNDGNWHMVTYTYNSGSTTNQVYIDGVLKVTENRTLSSSNAFSLGQNGDSTKGSADIEMSDFRVYNRILILSEIVFLYNSGDGRQVSDSAIIQDRYILDSQTGQIINSSLEIPNFGSNGIITGFSHGVIKN